MKRFVNLFILQILTLVSFSQTRTTSGDAIRKEITPKFVNGVIKQLTIAQLKAQAITNGDSTTLYYVTDTGKKGYFELDKNDNSSAGNDSTIIVTSNGKRLKRTIEQYLAPSTTGKYYRGDKTWQDLNKSSVGLSNVDNTSDLNKPISTATQTALLGKLDKGYTISELRSLSNSVLAATQVFYCNELGKEGFWRYDASDNLSADNLGTILVTSSSKRLKRIVSSNYYRPEWFGADTKGILDCSSIIYSMCQQNYNVLFSSGSIYYINSDMGLYPKINFKGEAGNSIIFGINGKISGSGISPEISNLNISGPLLECYKNSKTSSDIINSFSSPIFFDNSESIYNGSDISYSLSSGILGFSLNSISGNQKRSIASNLIQLDSTKSYSFHFDKGFLQDSKNFNSIEILKYNSSQNFISSWQPINNSGQDIRLSGASYIRIKLILRRSSRSINGTNKINLNNIKLFEVINQNNLGQTGGCFFFGHCRNSIITNNFFSNFPCPVIQVVSGNNFSIIKNVFSHVFNSIGLLNSSNIIVQNNTIDQSIKNQSDGLYYSQKSWRYSSIAGYNIGGYSIISGNVIKNSNWGIEFTPNTQGKINISNNSFFCSATGISVGQSLETNIFSNDIELEEGFNEMGVEVGQTEKYFISNNVINIPVSLYVSSRAISGSNSTYIKDGYIQNNILKATTGIYFGSQSNSSTGTLIIQGNVFAYDAMSIFCQYIRVNIRNNTSIKRGDSYVHYVQNSNYNISSDYTNIIENNYIECAPDGAIFAQKGFGVSPIGKYIIKGNTISNSFTSTIFFEGSNLNLVNINNNTYTGIDPSSFYSITSSSLYKDGNRKEDGTSVP